VKIRFQYSVRVVSQSLWVTLCLWLYCTSSFGADAVPGEENCDDRLIDRIEYSGNEITRDAVLDREILPMLNLPCSLDNIVDSSQAIRDLRLFKHVHPELELDGDELVLRYIVKEKIYFLPIPRFSRTSDGELRLGMQLRWDNFRGLQHRAKLTSEQRQDESDDSRSGYLHRFSYDVPRFMGSRLGMSFKLKNTKMRSEISRNGEVFGVSRVQTDFVALSFSRWLGSPSAARGLTWNAGLAWTRRGHDLISGELGPFEEGQEIGLSVGINNRQESDDLYRLRGHSYGLSFSLASTQLGSDYSYNRSDFYYIRYLPVGSSQLTNVNYRLQFGYSNGGSFGERVYSLGGGDRHRGLKPGARDGDVLTLFNLEYLSGLYRYPHMRWVLFTDIGNVQRHNDFDLGHQVVGLGAGMRWKLLAVSDTDLRVDVAWSKELDGPRFYFSTNLTF